MAKISAVKSFILLDPGADSLPHLRIIDVLSGTNALAY